MRKRILIFVLCVLPYFINCTAQVISTTGRDKEKQTTKTNTPTKITANGSKSSQSEATTKTNTLSVSSTNLSFPASGGSQTVAVKASSSWKIYITPSSYKWITTKEKGNTIVVSVEANNAPSPREGHFDIQSGEKTVRVHVSQDKPNILKVSSENLSFSASGGSQTVKVTASGTWSLGTNISAWGHLEQKGDTIKVCVEPNNTSSIREDHFVITSGTKKVRVNISQEKVNTLLVSVEQLYFPPAGGVKSITVEASNPWACDIENYSWGHLTTSGNTVVVSVDPNNNTNERKGSFTIKSGDIEKRINILQSAFTPQDLERIEKEQYENACQKGTANALLEYLRAYPNGQYADSASNKIAIAKAKAFDKYSTNEAFNEALAYAKDMLTRYTVKEYIKSCEKEKEKSKKKEKGKRQMSRPTMPEITDRETTTSNKPISKLSQRPSSDPTGYVNGHEWVDLGLSVKWATCNIGAESPYAFGDYYAWGEKKTKEEFSMENSLTYKINSDSIAGVGIYDVAESIWGGTWRLPTVNEINELIGNCKFEWSSRDGHQGYNVTGPSGESIFIPAAGWRCELDLTDAGEKGLYWSSTLIENNPLYAYGLYFFEGYFCSYWINHRIGGTVRPVTE